MKKSLLNLAPVELVGNLDMVGQILCQLDAGVKVPPAIVAATIRVLRNTRDDLAEKFDITGENIYDSPAYAAEAVLRDMADGE